MTEAEIFIGLKSGASTGEQENSASAEGRVAVPK